MNIGGIGLGGINNPKGNEDSKLTEQAKPAQQFNPNAQVVSGAEAGSAARLHVAGQINPKGPDEVDVATLGMVKVSDEQLGAFAARVTGAVVAQEAMMLNAVNTFAGKDLTLRGVVSAMLLAI